MLQLNTSIADQFYKTFLSPSKHKQDLFFTYSHLVFFLMGHDSLKFQYFYISSYPVNNFTVVFIINDIIQMEL